MMEGDSAYMHNYLYPQPVLVLEAISMANELLSGMTHEGVNKTDRTPDALSLRYAIRSRCEG